MQFVLLNLVPYFGNVTINNKRWRAATQFGAQLIQYEITIPFQFSNLRVQNYR